MGLFDGLLGHGTEIDAKKLESRLDGVLIEGEYVSLAYKIIRDFFLFTNKRLLLVDIQGITGSKVDYQTVPYKAIVRFSVETAGTFDLDAELKVWVSGTPAPLQKTLKKGTDVRGIQRALAMAVCGDLNVPLPESRRVNAPTPGATTQPPIDMSRWSARDREAYLAKQSQER